MSYNREHSYVRKEKPGMPVNPWDSDLFILFQKTSIISGFSKWVSLYLPIVSSFTQLCVALSALVRKPRLLAAFTVCHFLYTTFSRNHRYKAALQILLKTMLILPVKWQTTGFPEASILWLCVKIYTVGKSNTCLSEGGLRHFPTLTFKTRINTALFSPLPQTPTFYALLQPYGKITIFFTVLG